MDTVILSDDSVIDCVVEEVSSDTPSLLSYLEACSVQPVARDGWRKANESIKVMSIGRKRLICATLDDLRSHKRVAYCAVHSCTANSATSRHLTFFPFPKTALCKVWAKFTRRRSIREMKANQLHASVHSVCCAHFKLEDFVDVTSRNELVPNAIPSLYFASHCPWYLDKDYQPWHSSFGTETEDLQDNGMDTGSLLLRDSNKIDRWDLCEYHRLVIRSVTFVGTELEDIKFCFKCGFRVNDPVLVSRCPNVYKISCNNNHGIIVTTEFNEKFRDYVLACQTEHHLHKTSLPAFHTPCHLCNDHYSFPREVEQQNAEVDSQKSNRKRKRGRPKIELVRQPKLPVVFPPLVKYLFRFPRAVKYTSEIGVSCDEIKSSDMNVTTKDAGTQLSAGHMKSPDEINRNKELKRLRNKVVSLEKKVEKCRSTSEVAPLFNVTYIIENVLPNYFKGVTLKLIEMQFLFAVRKSAPRWPPLLITLAKVVENESPIAYNIISKLLRFPTRRTITAAELPPPKLQSVKLFLKHVFNTADKAVVESEPLLKTLLTEDLQLTGEPVVVETMPIFEEMTQTEEVEAVYNIQEAEHNFMSLKDADSANYTVAEDGEIRPDTDIRTILDEAIKELELNKNDENAEERIKREEEKSIVLEVLDGDSEISQFRILGSQLRDYGTGTYEIMAESVDSPEEGIESLEVRVVPSYVVYDGDEQAT